MGDELQREIANRHLKGMKQFEDLKGEVAELRSQVREVMQIVATLSKGHAP